jgi:predicted Zn-dependent protease
MSLGLFAAPSFLLLCAPGVAFAQTDALAGQSQRGKELMAAGRYADAVPVYRELVKAVPNNPGLLLNLGMALHLAGHDQDALKPLESALRLQPDLLPAALFLGTANLRLGRNEAAVAPLQKAVRLQPDNPDARSMLAEALLALARYAQAEPHLRRLSELAPTDPASWFDLGNVYEDMAGQAFDEILKDDPESPFALALAADAELKQDRRRAAFDLYRQAIARGAKLRGLHAAVASIYREAGHAEWAATEEQKEKQLRAPDCTRTPLECAFSAGRFQDVITAASKPSKTKTAETRYWLVRACNELAGSAFNRLTALPASAHSHEWMAQRHRAERRYLESADEWRRAQALAPKDPRLQLELAVTLRLGDDFAGAQKVLEALLSAAPDAPEPNYLLGDVLLARQQPERAVTLLEKALRLEPDWPHAHGALGRAYALLGRTADAIPHLEKALPVDTDGSLLYQLARSYQAAGRSDDAQKALADYQAFKQRSETESEAPAAEAPLPPPDGRLP